MLKKHKYTYITLGLAYLIMGIAFAVRGVYPFGDRQIMIIDNWHQYYPFMTVLQDKLKSGGSLFYSWEIGMGSNFWFLMAYYAMSPLYLLSILVPAKFLPEFMAFATMTKIALAGAMFTVYLKKVHDKDDISLVIFGLLYSFSGYLMGYYWNVMWLDSVYLLPILMLGLYKLIHESKPILYTVTLGVTLVVNFYIGYMVAIFTAIYFFKIYFDSYKWRFKHFAKTLLKVGIWSLIGVGLAAVVLLPAYKGLNMAYGTASANPQSFETYHSFLDLFNNLFLGVKPTVRSGLPNVFSGLIGLILIITYFVSPNISGRSKITTGGVLALLAVSFNINYLNFFWHGFHFPNEVPYRFSFVVTFVILSAVYDLFINLEKEKIARVGGGLIVYLILAEKLMDDSQVLTDLILYLNIGFILGYMALFYVWQSNKIHKTAFLSAIIVVVIVEASIGANIAVDEAGTTTKTSYPPAQSQIEEALFKLNALDSDFYRMDQVKWYSTNDPAFYKYNGVSGFTSTINAHTTELAETLGLAASPRANRLLYASNTPILNAFYNVRYLIDRNQTANVPNDGFYPLLEAGTTDVYASTYPLGLAFRVDRGILNWIGTTSNPFKSQEELLELATGLTFGGPGEPQLFTPLTPVAEVFTGAKKAGEHVRYVKYELEDKAVEGSAKTTFVAQKKGQTYVYLNPSWSDDATITLGDQTITYDMKRSLVVDLGVLEPGTEFSVTYDLNTGYNTFYYLEVMQFNTEAFASAYDILKSNIMTVETYSDTKIIGKVTFKEPGILYTSIPYDNGWTVTVDNKKVEPIKVLDGFIGLELDTGIYNLEFKYTPEGFVQGGIISLLSLVGLVMGVKLWGTALKRGECA